MKLLRKKSGINHKSYNLKVVAYTIRPHKGEEVALVFDKNSNMFFGSLLQKSFTETEFKAHLKKIERDHMIKPIITKEVNFKCSAVLEMSFQRYEYENVLAGAGFSQEWFDMDGTQQVEDMVSIKIMYNRTVRSGVNTIETRDEETLRVPTAIHQPMVKALKKAGFACNIKSQGRTK